MTNKRRPIAYVDGSITRRQWVTFGRRVTGHHRKDMSIIILSLNIVLLIINIAFRMRISYSTGTGLSRNDFQKNRYGLTEKPMNNLYNIDYQDSRAGATGAHGQTDGRLRRRATNERDQRCYRTDWLVIGTLGTGPLWVQSTDWRQLASRRISPAAAITGSLEVIIIIISMACV